MGSLYLVAGKGVRDADPDGTKTSVTPAWRSAILHIVGGSAPSEVSKANVDIAFAEATHAMRPLREITPNGGAYWNECDYHEPNWEQSFWGMENYRKLKTVKEKYDPDSLFRVW